MFSINFAALATTEGARFRWVAVPYSKLGLVSDVPDRKDAQAAGKDILVWTVNKPEQMMEV